MLSNNLLDKKEKLVKASESTEDGRILEPDEEFIDDDDLIEDEAADDDWLDEEGWESDDESVEEELDEE